MTVAKSRSKMNGVRRVPANIVFLSRLQTIDNVGQLFGRGLVSEDNRLMKSLNHDTCHLSRHDCDVKKWQTTRTPTLLCCFIF